MKPRIIALLAIAVAATLGSAAIAQATGELALKAGEAACIAEPAKVIPCQEARGLNGAFAVAVSPDGRNAYVAAAETDGVGILNRNTAGGLSQEDSFTSCVAKDGYGGACLAVRAVDGVTGVAVSPDGKNVYIASSKGGLAIFDRVAATGKLIQKQEKAGCVSDDGSGDTCQDGTALGTLAGVAVSPDGRNVYTAARESGAVAVFDRNPSTGALQQRPGKAGCIADDGGTTCDDGRLLAGASRLAVSPDGRSVYVTGYASGVPEGIAILGRDPATGALSQRQSPAGCVSELGAEGLCQSASGIYRVYDIAVSPDGKDVYVASVSGSSIARFARDGATGGLTQRPGTALGGQPSSIAISRDGRSVYATLPQPGVVTVLDRAPTGALARKADPAGCVSAAGPAGGCVYDPVLTQAYGVAVSPDGRNVYVAAQEDNAVSVFDRALARPAAGAQPDRLAPVVSGVRVKRGRVRYMLSEAARVRVVVERNRRGKRVRAKTLSLAGRAGANTARLRLRKSGRYRVTVTATDAAGNRSAARRAGFRVAR